MFSFVRRTFFGTRLSSGQVELIQFLEVEELSPNVLVKTYYCLNYI